MRSSSVIATQTGPIRTCVGCRAKAPKAELVRAVRVSNSSHSIVQLDRYKRLPGRGTYVHADSKCIQRALHGGFSRSFRSPIHKAHSAPFLAALENQHP